MKVGLLICTYNRPQYLSYCLDSLRRADLSKIDTVMFIDDCSTDPDVEKLINKFGYEEMDVIVIKKDTRLSIKDSMLTGLSWFFQKYFDIVINLDSDAVVNNKFVDALLETKQKYPDLMVTGFNCNTLNRDGSIRHQVLYTEGSVVFRKSVGGINLCISLVNFLKWVKPALTKTLAEGGNWDDHSCRNSMADSCPIAVVTPSVVDHIGFVSSMGHTQEIGGEPPDTAGDFKPLSLPTVTLVGVDDDLAAIYKAAIISQLMVQFGDVKILSHQSPINQSPIRKLGNKEEYSKFILKELSDYVFTDHILLIQADGFVINCKAWTDEFLQYDYIGAVWNFREEKNVGNGGFSLRSRRLQEILKFDDSIVLKNDHLIKNFAEDHNICYIYREYLEKKYDIKFAPPELCERFSIEAWGTKDNKYKNSFGFHGFGVDFTDAKLPYVPYRFANSTRKVF